MTHLRRELIQLKDSDLTGILFYSWIFFLFDKIFYRKFWNYFHVLSKFKTRRGWACPLHRCGRPDMSVARLPSSLCGLQEHWVKITTGQVPTRVKAFSVLKNSSLLNRKWLKRGIYLKSWEVSWTKTSFPLKLKKKKWEWRNFVCVYIDTKITIFFLIYKSGLTTYLLKYE